MEKEKRRELKQRKIQLSVLPIILIMVLIFIFSSKNAAKSDATSMPIAETITTVYETVFGNVTQKSHTELNDLFNHLVRKAAHMAEYMILSIFVSLHLYLRGQKGKKLFFIAVLFCVGYAATDEFHQLFVPGRSGQIKDVCIDGIGAILGVFIFYFIRQIGFVKRHIDN